MPKIIAKIIEAYRGVHLYNSNQFATILIPRPVGAISALPSKSKFIKGFSAVVKRRRK